MDSWEPLSPDEVARLFTGADFTWWVAGGWAIDLFLGYQTRPHHDIDVGVLRRDQGAVQHALAGWELWVADPPGELRPWLPGEALPLGVHDIWCRETPDGPWRVQLMLNESSGDRWAFRRDPSVLRPLGEAVLVSKDGIPFLAPELQLLFKAKGRRAQDDADLDSVLDALGEHRRHWLAGHLRRLHPGHAWIESLG